MYITSIFNRRSLLKQLYFYNIYDECLLLFPNSKFSVNISHKEEMIYIRLRKTNSKLVRITRSSIDDTSSWHCKIYQKIDYQYGRSCFAHADFFVNLNHTDLKALLLRISETDNEYLYEIGCVKYDSDKFTEIDATFVSGFDFSEGFPDNYTEDA